MPKRTTRPTGILSQKAQRQETVGRQPPAEPGADRGHAADRGAPDGEGDGAGPPDEGGVERGQRAGDHHGGPGMPRTSRGDEDRRRPGQARDDAGEHEDGHADREDPSPAVEVAHPADEEEQGREDQRYAALSHWASAEVRASSSMTLGRGDIDDRRVHDHRADPQAQGHPGASHPEPSMVERGAGTSCSSCRAGMATSIPTLLSG